MKLKSISLFCFTLLFILLSSGILLAQPKAVFVEKPGYRPREPLNRGKTFRPFGSPGITQRQPVIWGWRVELPDGTGLAFGGYSIRTDDPRPHTSLLRGGKWIPALEELRKRNPLQKYCDGLRKMRRPLHRITSLARHMYLEGLSIKQQKTFMQKHIFPESAKLLKTFEKERNSLRSKKRLGSYCSGQARLALKQLNPVMPALKALNTGVSHDKFTALRQARISLERAVDLLDAEPPARAFSMLAYDSKTKLYAVFGGDHLDFLMNDMWVFDSKKLRWEQRHPQSGPEPRADHLLESDGKGRLKMRGGYIYHKSVRGWDQFYYVHAGPGEWVYDLASNRWQAPSGAKPEPAGERAYRTGGYMPDHFTEGVKPNGAAHERILKNLPANTWVDLKPPKRFAGGRDWGTAAIDTDRDMIYLYAGGHCVYSGADVLHYHLGSNSWDQPVETELPPGYTSAGESVPGWSFNRRAWIPGHTWNSYDYHPGIKRLIVNGRQGLNNQRHDRNTYSYDPDLGDWEKRGRTTKDFDVYGTQVRYAPGLGMLTWYGDKVWLMNDTTLDWKELPSKGKLPGSRVDFCGMAHDPKRRRVLFFSGGSYSGTPFSGEVFSLAIPSLKASSFKPQGSEDIKVFHAERENSLSFWVLREVIYHPATDLFIFTSNLPKGYTIALDPVKNRWVVLTLPGTRPWGLSSGLLYDPKRDLIFSVNNHAKVSALRIDPKTLVIRTLAEVAAEIKK